MSTKKDYHRTTPEEGIYVGGPDYGLGCSGWLVFGLITMFMIPLVIVLLEQSPGDNYYFWFLPVPIAWVSILVLLLRNVFKKRVKAYGIDVLRDILQFDISSNYYGVGLTGFCRPDALQAGEQTALLLFMQNYSSRPRHVSLTLKRNLALGDLSGKQFNFELTPGQCAVYRQVFLLPEELKPGQYAVTGKLTVKFPRKQGVRLIPRSKKEQSLILIRSRSIVFSINVTEQEENTFVPISPDQEKVFLSLYYPEMTEPRFEILEKVANASPHEAISINPRDFAEMD